jgi:two-component system, chemotaxis family, sensor kinase CheA
MAMSDDESFQLELRKVFIADARQSLSEAEQNLLALEENPSNYEIVDKYFRFIHTIKGNAESIEFSSFGRFVHRFEDLLTALKKVRVPVNSGLIDLFLEVNDFIKVSINKYEADPAINIENTSLSDKIEQSILQLTSTISTDRNFDQASVAAEVVTPESKGLAASDDTLRVNSQKVNAIINYFSEQVILLASLKHHLEPLLLQESKLNKSLMELEKVTHGLQSATLGLRMFPLKQLFDQMRRVVRETAKSVGKDVRLVLKGETVELDKLVLDELSSPVMHIVRNAIDHGIEESPELRIKQGKPRQGTLTLEGAQKSGFLHLFISDDGGGINKEKLLAKAIANKVVQPTQQLSENEIFNLIFHKGLSTKDQATEISGRGVGMDVVLETLRKLKGGCEISSTPGRGTTFTVKVPLSLALFEGTVFRLGTSFYIIPNADYYEIRAINKDHITQQGSSEFTALVNNLRVPLVFLKNYLQLPVETPPRVDTGKDDEARVLAFVVNYRGKSFAIAFDEFVSQTKVVLKHLGKDVKEIFAISGATILGDGRVVLIVDITQILERFISEQQT